MVGSSTVARGALDGGVSALGTALAVINSVGGNVRSGREALGCTPEGVYDGGLDEVGSVGVVGGGVLCIGALGGRRAGGAVLSVVGSPPPKRGRRGAGRGD